MLAEEVNDLTKPVVTETKQVSSWFKPGQSGNPAGRPSGTRNVATMAAQALLDGEAEALSRKALEMALNGDITAMRLCLDRIVPPKKDSPVKVQLNRITSMSDAANAQSAILDAACNGEITPSEAAALSGIAQQAMKALELQEIEERLKRLEEKL